MFNLIRFALLFFALGVLGAPLLDRSGALEEFAFAMAEDAADQDTYLALPQFAGPSDHLGYGPFPQMPAFASSAENLPAGVPKRSTFPVSASERSFGKRPLYLLYHNFRFYDGQA
ncbi:MAG: hypothetical protein J5I94_23790 [Phaeodactylibacter sp.]|nr:hypothetical protein [Phaeodactylibacter sp.]